MKEPFNLTMDQIADLTDYQLLQIYFRPDPNAPAPPASDGGDVEDPRSIFEKVWARRGLTPEEIAAKWAAEHPADG